jgi:hypothetical protein
MGSTSGSTIVSIGDGDGIVYQVPVNHYYKFGWSEMIYLKSEINTDGNITKIRFQVEPSLPSPPYVAENQKIYMAHTTYSTLPNVVVKEDAQSNYASSNYMLVYDGTINWNIGWVEIVLQTPFPWNNTDNLLIKYENREGTFSANYPMFYYTAKTATVGYNYQDASYPTSDGTRDGFRPNLKLAISDADPLPVELISFQANCSESNTVDVTWSTASEHNTSHFRVDKSRNGTDWDVLGTIGAAENSTVTIDYALTDYSPNPGINYYRLLQYDKDGVYETFDVQAAVCKEQQAGTTLSTYPNPSSGDFNVDLNTDEMEGKGTLVVTDAKGSVVYSQEVNVINGNNSFLIQRFEGQPGMYYITVKVADKAVTAKHSMR